MSDRALPFTNWNADRLLTEYHIPRHLHGGIERYLKAHIRAGDFLMAIFRNDLADAMLRAADASAVLAVRQIVQFLSAVGAKAVETRSWATSYRGVLLIHASARRPSGTEAAFLHSQPKWPAALRTAGWDPRHNPSEDFGRLPYGAIVAVTFLRPCRPTASFLPEQLDQPRLVEEGAPTWTERQMGDFTPGRFGWPLTLIRALPAPVPLRGRQQLFKLAPEAEVAIFQQITASDLEPFQELLVGPLGLVPR